MGDIDVYDYTDGIFLGRYNAEAHGGVGAYDDGGKFDYNSEGIILTQPGTNLPIPTADMAYRVNIDNKNALYVQDIRKKYVKPRTTDISKNLLIHAHNIAQDQFNKTYTSTIFNYSGSDFSKNYVQLDVCAIDKLPYLETIYNRYFADQTVKDFVQFDIVNDKYNKFIYNGVDLSGYKYTTIGFGSSTYNFDYSGIFTSSQARHDDISYNKLMIYDYSANRQYIDLLNAFKTYTTTQQLTEFVNIQTNADADESPLITQTTILNTNNTIVLTNRKTHSISFYGMVTKSCRISVVYVFNMQVPSMTDKKYWIEQTQYDTSIKKSGKSKFGFNIDNVNAPYVTLVFRDPNTGALLSDSYVQEFEIYASYSYKTTVYSDNIEGDFVVL